jgi:hypothetical protein
VEVTIHISGSFAAPYAALVSVPKPFKPGTISRALQGKATNKKQNIKNSFFIKMKLHQL